jgi:hypothetical protein
LRKRLRSQILELNGYSASYYQIKWILSDIMAKANTLILLDMNSHAKMAPDTLLLILLVLPASAERDTGLIKDLAELEPNRICCGPGGGLQPFGALPEDCKRISEISPTLEAVTHDALGVQSHSHA